MRILIQRLKNSQAAGWIDDGTNTTTDRTIVLAADEAIVWGGVAENGAYRTHRDGNDLVTERMESDVWVEKSRVTA